MIRAFPYLTVLLVAFLGTVAHARYDAVSAVLIASYRVEPSPILSMTVVRSAPFTGRAGFGVTEDTTSGEVIFAGVNGPWIVELLAKELSLIRTLRLPIPGAVAPAFFIERIMGDSANLPAGSAITLQGAIINQSSSSSNNASMTSAIALSVEASSL